MALWGLTRNSLERREKYKNGVKGIYPLGCLPLWGREGVTFVFFLSQQKYEQNQVFSRADKRFF
jgi:hypothetical protein